VLAFKSQSHGEAFPGTLWCTANLGYPKMVEGSETVSFSQNKEYNFLGYTDFRISGSLRGPQ